MRQTVRKVAFVGTPDRDVVEALREAGYRTDAVEGESVFALLRRVYGLKPHLIHAREHHLKAALVAQLYGIPFIAHVGAGDLTRPVAMAARLAERTLSGGAAVREGIVALGAPAARTCIVRSLLDVTRDLHAASTLPPMLDPASRWVVAASPADSSDRGHCDLLLAFLAVARSRPDVKLLIAGDGAEASRLRAHADQAGMRGRVIVHALQLEQLPAVFAKAAVVVGPSRDGTPDAMPEALAVGAPVIATAAGPHPTWIREGRTGWLVPARAPSALAARLAQVLDDEAQAKRVGEAARKAALELAAPRMVAQELSRCYAAVGGRAAPSAGLSLPVPAVRLSRA